MAKAKKEATPGAFDLDAPTKEELQMQEVQNEDVHDSDSAVSDSAETHSTDNANITKTYVEMQEDAAAYEAQRKLRQTNTHIAGIYASAVRSKQILEGRIATVEAGEKTAYWVCYDGPVTIRIPCAYTFVELPEDLRADRLETVEDKVRFLSKCIGATVPYVVTDFQEDAADGFIATASRVAALSRIRARYYGKKAPRPVQIGDVVDAQIISAGAYAAYVNVKGIDTRIRNADMSHRYIPNINQVYAVGDTIRVKVTDIQSNGKALPAIIVSGREAERDNFPMYYHRVKKGNQCKATIITIQNQKREDGNRLLITCFLDDIGLPAYVTTSHLNYRDHLNLGDSVIFEMHGITNSGYVHGKFARLLRR